MDRFSEQLINKIPDGKDWFIRGLIIAGEMLVIAALVVVTLLFQFSILPLSLALLIGSFIGVKWLMERTMIEYEYIVTNDDLDIDKVIGRKSRKRLITVSLRTVKEMAEYTNNELRSDVTVIAHDNTGENLWYIISDDERYGALAVVFNPDKNTRENMIGGFDPKVRANYTIETEETSEEEKTEEASEE